MSEEQNSGRLRTTGVRAVLRQRPRLHFVGICGKGMGAIASALAREGWAVSGSDAATYPPMSNYLERQNIPVRPFDAAAVSADESATTLFVIGKRVDPGNPELDSILERRRPRTSLPELLSALTPPEAVLAVVTGGVGKTTTTALLTWVLEHAGLQPDYFIGGMLHQLEHPARWRGAPVGVVEGDEYASCFDDPTPKFLHFLPRIIIVTNLLEDHPDLTTNLAATVAELAGKMSTDSVLIGFEDDLGTVTRLRSITCQLEKLSSARLAVTGRWPTKSQFLLDGESYEIALCGSHNIHNAAMTVLAARRLGLEPRVIAEALTAFPGVANRQEGHDFGGLAVVFDKATHPAAITGFIEGQRQRYPDRRILLLLQPRATGGRHWIYQRDLPAACAGTDGVFLADPYEHRPAPGVPWESQPFDIAALARDIARHDVPVWRVGGPDDLVGAFSAVLRGHADVVLVSLPEQAHAMRAAVWRALAP